MGQFARFLPEFGWDVTVLTGRHGAGAALDDEVAMSISARANVISTWSPSASLIKRGVPAPKHGLKGAARRLARTAASSALFPDRYIFWVPGAIKAGRDALKRTPHDAVLASHGPASNLIVGRALAAEFRLPFIVDFRDLWATSPVPEFPSRIHRAAAFQLEDFVLRRASRLTAVAPAMASDLASRHGMQAERAIAITNGFDPTDAARVTDARPVAPRPFRLMYTGTIHVHYNVEPLWRALRALADAGEITPETLRLEFIGNLSLSDVRRHGLSEFIEVSPYVPHKEVFEAFARADALLLVETAGYYARYSYAAKVFDYLLTGKPVVGMVERGGNSQTLLEQAGVGHCVEPADEAGLRRVLLDVMKLKGAAPRRVDIDAPPFRDFNRRHLIAKLASVLEDAATCEPHGRW